MNSEFEQIKKRRLPWIDCAKGIGMLCVILGHTGFGGFETILYTFHLPLFFFLAGYTFNGEYDFSVFIKKKIKRMIIPYFSLGVLLVLWYCLRKASLWHDYNPESYYNLLRDLFVQKRFLSIWFIAALFVSELLFYGIYHLTKKNDKYTIIGAFSIGVVGFVYFANKMPALPWNADLAIAALTYLSLGYCIKKLKLLDYVEIMKPGKRVLIASICCIFTCITAMVSYYLSGVSFDFANGTVGKLYLTVPAAISGIIFILIFSTLIKSKILEFIGRKSIVFLALHQSVFIIPMIELSEAYGILNMDIPSIRLVRAILVVILTIACCTLSVLVLEKCKMKCLIGE